VTDASFVCQCGRVFIVGPGKHVCRTCGTVHYYQVSQAEIEAKRAERLERVRTTVANQRKLISAVKARSNGLAYGDAMAYFADLAVKYGSTLASDLTSILYACGCTKAVAIESLNKQGWPEFTGPS
jgi:uncharacterized Zn finger protein (UPF0148 family)